MTNSLDELKNQHPEWCFDCGNRWLTADDVAHHAAEGLCPENPVVAALLALVQQHEATIAELRKEYAEAEKQWEADWHDAADYDLLKSWLAGQAVDATGAKVCGEVIQRLAAAHAELVEYAGTMCHALEINAPGEDAVKNREQVADAIRTIRSDFSAAQATIAELERENKARANTMRDVEQIAGKALGYPWFKDDPKNFPDATETDGVCIGDHVTETIVEELASAFQQQARELEEVDVALIEARKMFGIPSAAFEAYKAAIARNSARAQQDSEAKKEE